MNRTLSTQLMDFAPCGSALTTYDRTHAATYIRLLDARDADATWQDAVRQVFRLDPDSDPERLERMHRSHLERAEWMRKVGFHQLAQQPAPEPQP